MKRTKFNKLTYNTYDGKDFFIYTKGTNAYITLNQICELYNKNTVFIQNLIDDIFKQHNVFNKLTLIESDKTVLYNIYILEEIDKVLKEHSGNLLIAYVKNIFKLSKTTFSDVIVMVLELLSNL